MAEIVKKIYTLGTGRRRLEDFVEIINSYSIEVIIDVRSLPTSRLNHFRKTNLESALRKELFEYHYLGKELGGFRRGGYDNYTRSEEFQYGIDALEAIASQKICAVICAEHFPWKCHRRFIARALQRQGWVVEHIIDKGKVWVPK